MQQDGLHHNVVVAFAARKDMSAVTVAAVLEKIYESVAHGEHIEEAK